MENPRITTLEAAYATGTWNNLFLGVWRGPVTLDGVRAGGVQQGRMATLFPGGFGSLVVVEQQVPVPDQAERRGAARGMEQGAHALRGMAGVMEVNGFTGAIFRSIQIALSAMVSSPYPRKGFSSVSDAAVWLAPLLGMAPGRASSRAVAEAMNTFRQMIAMNGASAEMRITKTG